MDNLSEAQLGKIGKEMIELFQIKRKKGIERVDTSYGSKTEVGLGRIVIRILKEVQQPMSEPLSSQPTKVPDSMTPESE